MCIAQDTPCDLFSYKFYSYFLRVSRVTKIEIENTRNKITKQFYSKQMKFSYNF